MKKTRRILSVDWDYFFPDAEVYDWGHSESRGLFYEIIWQTRVANRNLITGAKVLDDYRPSVPKNFWSKVLANKPVLFVGDSHVHIWDRLTKNLFTTVVSLDAHHDCGYKNGQSHVDCSNWGLWGLITGRIQSFHLYYPEWRDGKEEDLRPIVLEYDFHRNYGLPSPEEYDEVFICRSGVWTPPWFDHSFQEFVDVSGLDKKLVDELAWKVRSPSTIEEATKLADTLSKALQLHERAKSKSHHWKE